MCNRVGRKLVHNLLNIACSILEGIEGEIIGIFKFLHLRQLHFIFTVCHGTGGKQGVTYNYIQCSQYISISTLQRFLHPVKSVYININYVPMYFDKHCKGFL